TALGTVGTDAGWYMRSTVAGQAAAGDFAYTAAIIENVRTLAGRTVTLSFVASSLTAGTKVAVEVIQVFGASGSPVWIASFGAVTLTTTLTRYSVTFVVPSVAGKTLGTDGKDNLQMVLWTSAGDTYASRASNIGIQNASVDITDIQLELGPVATPFE